MPIALKRMYEDKWLAACCVLVVVSSVLFLSNLSGRALHDYDEAIYAQVIKDTAASGDILTLKRYLTPWFEKPPLYFWVAMGTHTILPDVELAYRLPSALTGIASIILVMLIAFAVTRNYPVALAAGLVLLTSPPFFEAAREVRLDTPVTAAILFSLLSFIKAREDPRWYFGAGVGVALGVLTKGVIGLLAGPLILIWLITTRDYSWVRSLYFWTECIISFSIVAPWHIYETVRYGSEFWASYIGSHVLGRFEGNILGEEATATNLNYVRYLFTFALPWSIVAPLGAVRLFRARNELYFRPALAFLLQIIFLLVIFFVAGTKLPYYLTPIYPLGALFLAIVGWHLYEQVSGSNKKIALGVAGLVLAVAIAQTINVGFHFHAKMRINDLLSSDERSIGLMLKDSEVLPVFAYKYKYWDTISYYGDRKIQTMEEDKLLDEPFYLVLPRGFFDINPFPPELSVRFTSLFVGEAVTLLRYDLVP